MNLGSLFFALFLFSVIFSSSKEKFIGDITGFLNENKNGNCAVCFQASGSVSILPSVGGFFLRSWNIQDKINEKKHRC